MSRFVHGVKLAGRFLVRNRSVAIPAALSLALGIGANMTIATFLQAAFLQPLPVEEPRELVSVYSLREDKPGRLSGISQPNFLEYLSDNSSFSGLTARRSVSVSLETEDGIQVVFGEIVTHDYFEVLGISAARGRIFTAEQARPDGSAVVVLGHDLWRKSFGGDPSLLGKSLKLNGHEFTVIGIAPQKFRGLDLFESPELWVPMEAYREVLDARVRQYFDRRDAPLLSVTGRLAPGVSREQAEAAMMARTSALVEAFPKENEGLGVSLVPLVETVIPFALRPKIELAASLLAAVVGLLLLVACSNVANLLLARSLARRREVAVREALGAGRGQLARLLLGEGMALAAVGGLGAVFVALAGRELLWALRPPFFPESLDLSFQPPVVALGVVLTLATGLLVAVIPAVRGNRLDLSTELRERSGGQRHFGRRGAGRLLVIFQVVLSVVVLVGAGLFLRSLQQLQQIDAGFETENLFFMPIARPYGAEEGAGLYPRLMERIEGFPEVRAATLSSRPSLAPGGGQANVKIVGSEDSGELLMSANLVEPGYFEAMGIRLRSGRWFTDADRGESPRVAVVNETFAARWPGGNPVGGRLRFGVDETEMEVVGVVKDIKYGSLNEEPRPYLYLPVLQDLSPMMVLHVWTRGEPGDFIPALRKEIQTLDATLPFLPARLIPDLIRYSMWAPRLIAGLLGLFGLLALILSAVGIYGLMSYSTELRHREIGIRIALGAERNTVLGWVMGQGLQTVAIGVGVGLLLCVFLVAKIEDLLFGIGALDPLSFAGAALVLMLVALLASWVPARRATAVDPIVVLRDE